MIAINADNLSDAWAQTLGAVLDAGGRAVNVITSWEADNEHPEVRKVLDAFVSSRPAGKNAAPRYSAETVANTIFAEELYESELGADALSEFTALYLEGYEISQAASPGGEYCHRLVAWEGPDGKPVNQLLEVAKKLRRYSDQTSFRYSSVYELALEDPVLDLRTQMPGRNRDPYGFPCLSHISLTVVDNTVHLTALYRNQHLVNKAYGNYLGLSRLGRALCHHAGLDLGTITVVATHADAQVGSAKGLGKNAINSLHADAVAASPTTAPGMEANTEVVLVVTETAVRNLLNTDVTNLGVDVVDIDDFARDINNEQHVLDAMFTHSEQQECGGRAERLASRLALKEATLKILSTGIRGLDVLDVVIETADDGKPSIQLSDAAAAHAAELNLVGFRCSTSRDAGIAIGVVLATEHPPSKPTTANGPTSLQEAS